MLNDPVKIAALDVIDGRSLEELTTIARAHITRLKVQRGDYVLLDAEKHIGKPSLVPSEPRSYPQSWA